MDTGARITAPWSFLSPTSKVRKSLCATQMRLARCCLGALLSHRHAAPAPALLSAAPAPSVEPAGPRGALRWRPLLAARGENRALRFSVLSTGIPVGPAGLE